ncbi:hypothetical protein [Candidatus Lokiarchaeum ossiferum]|uniref:hypothetical protein n=1 Tax=Candidatus Lokiarchaeum ossiferum TaxID=2951803 RepID=UPI00352C3280
MSEEAIQFWYSVLGSALTFIFAIILLYVQDWIKKRKDNERKCKILVDFYNSLIKIYTEKGLIQFYRIFPKIEDLISEKLQMIGKSDFETKIRNGGSFEVENPVAIKETNPHSLQIWFFDDKWELEISKKRVSHSFKHQYSLLLRDCSKEEKFGKKNPEVLIRFLKYIEKKLTDSDILEPGETFLNQTVFNLIKNTENYCNNLEM